MLFQASVLSATRCSGSSWPRAAPCVEAVSRSTFPEGFHFPSTFEDPGAVTRRMGQGRGPLNGDVSEWMSPSSCGYYSGQTDLLGFSSCGDIYPQVACVLYALVFCFHILPNMKFLIIGKEDLLFMYLSACPRGVIHMIRMELITLCVIMCYCHHEFTISFWLPVLTELL